MGEWYEDPQGSLTYRAIIAYFDSKQELTDLINAIKKEFPDEKYKITSQNSSYLIPLKIISVKNFLIISFEGCRDPYGYTDDPLDIADPIFDSILIKVYQSSPKLIIYDRGKALSYADNIQKGIENLKRYTENVIKPWFDEVLREQNSSPPFGYKWKQACLSISHILLTQNKIPYRILSGQSESLMERG